MHANCEACAHGPAGGEGHQDLLVQAIGGYRMLLKCARCASFWSRAQRSEADFEWTQVSHRSALGGSQGIPVPPRSGGSHWNAGPLDPPARFIRGRQVRVA